MNKNIKLKIIGTIFDSTGYSIHTRQLANALNKQEGIEVILECPLVQNWNLMVNDSELEMIKKDKEDYDVQLFIGQPQFAPLYWNEDKPFIQFVVWEGDKVPRFWIDYLKNDNINMIFVPSIFTKEAIKNTLEPLKTRNKTILDKVYTVPHGVDLNLFYPDKKKKDKFTFLIDKGYRNKYDRGGTQFAVEAFLNEFSSKDDVKMLVKVNPAYGVGAIRELFKTGVDKDYPEIAINEEMLEYKDLVKLYNEGDVFVNCSQAEAFHLGALQALACGLPVITNDFGGQMDFLNDKNSWILNKGELYEIKNDVNYEGISWKKPNIKEIREKMRYVYEHQDEVKKKSKQAVIDSKDWTWDKSAEKVKDILQKSN